MCQSLVGWQLALLVPETGRKPVPPSLGRGDGGRPVCSQPSPALPTSRKGGRELAEGGREGGTRESNPGVPGTWFCTGRGICPGIAPTLLSRFFLPWAGGDPMLGCWGAQQCEKGCHTGAAWGFILPFSPTFFRGALGRHGMLKPSSLSPPSPKGPSSQKPLGLILGSRILDFIWVPVGCCWQESQSLFKRDYFSVL